MGRPSHDTWEYRLTGVLILAVQVFGGGGGRKRPNLGKTSDRTGESIQKLEDNMNVV